MNIAYIGACSRIVSPSRFIERSSARPARLHLQHRQATRANGALIKRFPRDIVSIVAPHDTLQQVQLSGWYRGLSAIAGTRYGAARFCRTHRDHELEARPVRRRRLIDDVSTMGTRVRSGDCEP